MVKDMTNYQKTIRFDSQEISWRSIEVIQNNGIMEEMLSNLDTTQYSDRGIGL